MSNFHDKIKKIRDDKGYTQQGLADLLGLKRSTISNIENGLQRPTTDFLIPFAKEFGVSLDSLFDIPQKIKPKTPDQSINELIDQINDSTDLVEIKQLVNELLNKMEEKFKEIQEVKDDLKKMLSRIPNKF